MIRLSTLLLFALLAASCRNNANNVVLASLDRSDKLSLVCGQVVQSTGNLYQFFGTLPLALCDDQDVTFEIEDLPPDTAQPNAQPQFLGPVTQTQAGTVAVVNFSNGAIFDTSVTVPGVTALRVGEQPTAIQISPIDSRYTYVSSFSPKSVQAIPTRKVITGSAAAQDYQPLAPELPSEELRFDVGPTDLALHELAEFETTEIGTTEDGEPILGVTTNVTYRYLYVALPELSQIVQIQVEIDNDTGEQTFGTVTEIPLPSYGCDSVTPVPPPASTDADYLRICPADGPDEAEIRYVKEVTTTVPCAEGEGTGAMPVALSIDYGDPDDVADDLLLVADARQPVVHRFGVFTNGATQRDPIVTLAPTIAIATTPYVPASSDPDDREATERYLYAVTANDGSVLAVDYTPTSSTFGAVLPIIAGITPRANEENVESRNRSRAGFSNARAIEVIAPFYELERDPSTGGLRIPEGDDETDICNPNDPDQFALAQNAQNFRGVFLAVSLSNGTMYFLDIYDLNAPCRGGDGPTACTTEETGPDRLASIRRHRRRFSFTPSQFIRIDGTPSLQFNASPGNLNPLTGQPTNSDGPGLSEIQCPVSHSSIFPVGDAPDGFLCASSQVWSSFSQLWSARWQGPIPGSEGGLGSFSDESFQGEPGNWFLAGDVPFCQVGVIGRQNGTPQGSGYSIDELSSYIGDRLVITGELPLSTQDDPACQQFVDLLEDIDDRQVWFPIIRAFNDQLEIGSSPNPSRYTLEEVSTCFNQYTGYRIQTRNVYAVTGSASSFIHDVIADESNDGLCIFNPARPPDIPSGPDDDFDVDTYLTARAFPGTTFVNPLVSFHIDDFAEGVTPTDSTVALLNFGVLNEFGTDILVTGSGSSTSLPASIVFSPEIDQLFFVDFEIGVRRIVFSPLSIVQTFE